ncbi:UPF0157-domain-containing protein [Eremomyces bilateralis CBS 781.70]|uniref:UPF0157-domain-containing protein n=1 Tax=Eremomyces bilateralis CBS 781.70 TaxID=1392243 RepID=A0A6G1GA40_9PEZI|nr:UPF0157-domain-containing protein [Eremomyces bilateralis CBS 781.70]KAF1814780.1 UPF0157-domain-containing protein [Eremomyces bilateralis CBS 781.70]
MPIIVEPYDPQWPISFQALRTELTTALFLVPFLSIEHVGSTSVPGLAAKPILDIDVIVARPHVAAAIAALEARLGYTNMGEWGVPDRWALRRAPEVPARNLYVVVEGCQAVRNHLAVRDVLRNDWGLRKEYARVKMALAGRTQDLDEYVEGKSEVIMVILGKGGFGGEELEEIRNRNRKPDTKPEDIK